MQQLMLEFARCSTDITQSKIRGTLKHRLLVPAGLLFKGALLGYKI